MHMRNLILGVSALLLLLVYFLLSAFSEDQISYNRDIRPVINAECIACHGGVKASGKLSFLTRDEALATTESGIPAIIPGDPAGSELIRRLRHHDPEQRMPLEGEPLDEATIQKFEAWIEQGANWEEHWSFIPPEKPEVPETGQGWVRNEIDRFVYQKLEEEGLTPNPEADKSVLLRRLYLDLIGLPPTPGQTEAFLADKSEDAYEKVVDQLLASAHYGERWAAMWLDLARYADSKGYEKDLDRSIWKYRDWVIQAFNQNMPFDQFTIEQLAGDLLPKPTESQLIATAFHRNTMSNDEGGTRNEEFRAAAMVDRVSTTYEVWQGMTMSCVQCHTHPYDPIRHEEYYEFYAFLNNTADADVPSESPNLKEFKKEEDRQKLEELKNWVIQHTESNDEKLERGKQLVKMVKFTEPKVHPKNYEEITDGALGDGKYLEVDHGGYAMIPDFTLDGKDEILVSYRAKKASGKGIVEFRKGSLEGEVIATWQVQPTPDEGWGFHRTTVPLRPTTGTHDIYMVFKEPGNQGRLCTIEWVLFHKTLPGKNQPQYAEVKQEFIQLLNTKEIEKTPVMIERPEDYSRKTHVFERGNWLVHGEEVEPDVPQAWPALPEGAPQNRLGMAQWLVSPENPLTARVTVNRFWAQLFGTGIVETVEDFGTQGAKPTHPELLDWLAMQFMHEYDWSIKRLLKEIVISATYRQSSKVTPQLQEADPANQWLARGPRVRLSAEQIRDQALAVSGLLSDKMYGPSVMPPQPEGIWQVVYSGQQWETSEGEDQYRRGIYTYWRRTSPYPSMIAFDSPSREFCVTRRVRTNTPLQALVTLNDPVFMEAAKSLAQRMMQEGGERPEAQIASGYRIAMAKEISAKKREALLQLYQESMDFYQNNPEETIKMAGEDEKNQQLAALAVVANAMMNLDEFVTKS